MAHYTILRLLPRLRRLLKKLIKYLQLQLFLTLCSWPLLLYWGLPLSLASIIGNLIFGPFLTCFLLLSCLIFFLNLLMLPATPFTLLLEWLSHSWSYLLSQGNPSWLVAFPAPPLIVGLSIPLAGYLVLHHKKLISPLRSVTALTCILIITALLLNAYTPQDQEFFIPCFGSNLTILQRKSTAVLIDPGCIGRRISAPSFVRYTLMQTLTRKGISTLNAVIITKPSSTVFRAAATLVDSIEVKNLFLPAWKGKLKNRGWAAWELLKVSCKARNTQLHCVDTPEVVRFGSQEVTLSVTKQLTKRNGLVYYPLAADVQFGG